MTSLGGFAQASARWSDDLTTLIRRAACIHGPTTQPVNVTFTSLALAFFCADDAFSRWLQASAAGLGLTIERIWERWSTEGDFPSGATIERLEEAMRAPVESLPAVEAISPSSSVQQLLESADSMATVVDPKGAIGARHLFAAYAFRPLQHREEVEAWGFDRAGWIEAFMAYVEENRSQEASGWQAHERQAWVFSHGVSEAISWAAVLASLDRGRPPGQDVVGPGQIFCGILVDGFHDSGSNVTSSWLLRELGATIDRVLALGSDAIEQLETRRPPGTALRPIFDATTLRCFRRANVLAGRTSQGTIHVRHLIGAFVALEPPQLVPILARAGRTVQSLRQPLLARLEAETSVAPAGKKDDIEPWRRALAGPAADGPALAAYTNDEASGVDHLGMARDVNAFAAVLASRDLSPPLSVGLFGDWGSGKSFFMQSVRDRIKHLAAKTRALPLDAQGRRAGRLCGEIAQISFNAWQYMDSNLWASLATHVFDQLNEELASLGKPEGGRYIAELASIKERQSELEAERTALARTVAQKDEELAKVRAARAGSARVIAGTLRRRIDQDPAVQKALEDASKTLGLKEPLRPSDVRARLEELREFGGRLKVWWRTLVAHPLDIVVALAIIGVSVALAGVVAEAAMAPWLPDLLRYGTPVVTLAASFWRRTSGLASRLDAALAWRAEAEKSVRENPTADEKALLDAQAAAAAAEKRLEEQRLALEARRTELEAEIVRLGDGRSYKKFIAERAASEDYRRQLGAISAVHRDFKQLSALLSTPDEPHVDRIILYIDDLDRCPPDRVVEVLQAIHVVLSLRLFVVVVAVDSHWLLQSLEAYYARQFKDVAVAIESRPQKYLEKIFQIPYAIAPMTAAGFGDLVSGLLRPAEAAASDVSGGVGGAGSPAVAPLATAVAQQNVSADEASEPQLAPAPPAPTAAPPATVLAPLAPSPAADADLNPRILDIPAAEIQHLAQFHASIPSPRAAKRMVNLYRFIRAGLSPREHEWFVARGYRATQLCLAITVGYPGETAALFAEIFASRLPDGRAALEFLRHAGAQGNTRAQGSAREERWHELANILEGRDEMQRWDDMKRAAQRVAPYSFETGRTLRLLASKRLAAMQGPTQP